MPRRAPTSCTTISSNASARSAPCGSPMSRATAAVVAGVVIALLVVASSWQLLRDAVDVLMETAPRHLDVEEIRAALRDVAGVIAELQQSPSDTNPISR